MADYFDAQATSLDAPAAGAFSVTPSDSLSLPVTTRAVYVGGGGALVVEMKSGGTVTFENLPDAALLPVRVSKVLEASTATDIVGLY